MKPPRSPLKQAILAACATPRTALSLVEEFGPKAHKCVNNMALRRTVVNVSPVPPAQYQDKRKVRSQVR